VEKRILALTAENMSRPPLEHWALQNETVSSI